MQSKVELVQQKRGPLLRVVEAVLSGVSLPIDSMVRTGQPVLRCSNWLGDGLTGTLQSELLTWSAKQRLWQRDLLRRLALGEELALADYRAYADHVASEELKTAGPWAVEPTSASAATEMVPLSADQLQVVASDKPSVSVTKILHLEGANALAPGATIDFEPRGLSIVAGKNGSGKSGFTRLLKQVCISRGPETIHPNAFGNGEVPSAVVSFAIGTDPATKVSWKRGTPDIPSALHRVRVFDSHAADAHLAGSNEVAYVPPVLQSLSGYTQALGLIAEELRKDLDIERSGVKSLPELRVGQLLPILDNLGTESSKVAIAKLGVMTSEETKELARLPTLLQNATVSDPATLVVQARGRSQQLLVLANKLASVAEGLGLKRLNDLLDSRLELAAADAAVAAAAKALGEEGPLPGVGSAAWRSFWAHASALAAEHEHTLDSFPDEDGTNRCALCHQPTTDGVEAKFRRFADWMETETQATAVEARKVYVAHFKAMRDLPLDSITSTAELTVFALHDQSKASKLQPICDEAVKFRDSALLNDDVLSDLKNYDLHTRLVQFELAAREASVAEESTAKAYADIDSNAAEVEKLSNRLMQLQHRALLVESLADVNAEHDRQIRIARLELAVRRCDTGAASRLNTKLSKDYVSKVCTAFRLEARRLGLARTPVELVFDRTSKGVSYIKVALVEAPNVPVATVLSEGERRVAAVAGFFADLTESGDTSALVFDDPVSSLDQEYREAVARRLLLEAKSRQVLVFSHDNTFIHYLYEQKTFMDLEDRANGNDETEFVALHYLHIARSTMGAGLTTDAEHWRHVPVKERIGRLKARVQKARPLYTSGDDVRYEKEAKDIVGGIRETWEAFVEQELLNGIVMRHERAVQTQRLKRIVDLTESDVATVTLGMSIESTYMTGHASPLSSGTVIGDPEWLMGQIARLVDFRRLVEHRRNG